MTVEAIVVKETLIDAIVVKNPPVDAIVEDA
jgi:hypothetical protein